MRRDRAWLLRRFREGSAPVWDVRAILEEEHDRLVGERAALDGETEELRRSVPSQLRAFEEATTRYLRRRDQLHYAEASRELTAAAAALGDLRRQVEAAAALREVASDLERMMDLLPSSLSRRTTPRILRRLRDLARELIDQGQTRKAQFVIFLLRDQLSRLRSGPEGSEEQLGAFLSGFDERHGEAIDALADLRARHYGGLAARLAEDLLVDVSWENRRRRESQEAEGSLGAMSGAAEEIRRRADSLRRNLAEWLRNSD